MTLIEILGLTLTAWISCGLGAYNVLTQPDKAGPPPSSGSRIIGILMCILFGPIALAVTIAMPKDHLYKITLLKANSVYKGNKITLFALEDIVSTHKGLRVYGDWYFNAKLGLAKKKGAAYYFENLRIVGDELLGDLRFYAENEFSQQFRKEFEKGKIAFCIKGKSKSFNSGRCESKIINALEINGINALPVKA